MTNTPEQTLSDLLALIETGSSAEIANASVAALPALREYMEERKRLIEAVDTTKAYLREQALSGMSKSQQEYHTPEIRRCRADLASALSRLGGK